jgi:hypothetical protein
LVVSLLVLGVLLAVHGPRHSNTASPPTTGRSSAQAGTTPASRKAPTYTAPGLPAGWVSRASDIQTNCAAHSYGEISDFLSKTPCSAVRRQLATTTQGGRQIVVASYVVTFDTSTQAASFDKIVTADGTGNISDLLREGVRYAGGPQHLSDNAAFASRQDGSKVYVAEAAWAHGDSDSADAKLGVVAQQAVT